MALTSLVNEPNPKEEEKASVDISGVAKQRPNGANETLNTWHRKGKHACGGVARTAHLHVYAQIGSTFRKSGKHIITMVDSYDVQLFRTVAIKHNGTCSALRLLQECPDIGSIADLQTLLEENGSQFGLAIQNDTVIVNLPGIQICAEYNKGVGCADVKCQYLHLCEGLVQGSCTQGAKCKLHHRLKSEHNSNIVRRLNTGRNTGRNFTEEDVLLYLKLKWRMDSQERANLDEDKGENLLPSILGRVRLQVETA